MGGMATTAISFPAAITTKDGLTHQVKDKAHLTSLGLDGLTVEVFRGAYREVGLRSFKDGKVTRCPTVAKKDTQLTESSKSGGSSKRSSRRDD